MKDFDIFMTDLFPYLEGEELKDSILNLTIKDIRQEKMKSYKGKEESKYVLYFQETPKGFVLNKTNAKRIAILHGKMTGGWNGKRITLYTEEVKAFGETHNALRVAEAVPGDGEQADNDLDWMYKSPSKGRFFGGIKKAYGIEPAMASKMLKAGGYTNGYDPILAPEMEEFLRSAPMPQATAIPSGHIGDGIVADTAIGDLEDYYPEIFGDKSE